MGHASPSGKINTFFLTDSESEPQFTTEGYLHHQKLERIMSHRLATIAFLLPLIWTACLEENESYEVVEKPTVEVFDGERFLSAQEGLVVKPTPGAGSTHQVASLEIQNTGNGILSVIGIRIINDPSEVFSLSVNPSPKAGESVQIAPKNQDQANSQLTVDISVNPAHLIELTTSTLEITTSPDKNGKTLHFIPLACEVPQPELTVNPGSLDFGMVMEGDTKESQVQLVNTGTDALVITGVSIEGDSGFTLLSDGETRPDVPQAAMMTIEAGKTDVLKVQYISRGPQAAAADLIIASNDLSQPQGAVIPLLANTGGPCIAITPGKLKFGGKLVGKMATMNVAIASCGDEDLVISKASLSEDSDGAFSLLQEQDDRFPMILGVNEVADLQIAFVPEFVAALGENGMPDSVVATLNLETNTYGRSAEVAISGYGVDSECPTAVIHVPEGEEVCPQTNLHLSGSQSYSPNGAISHYQWEVVQPNGSVSQFLPSTSMPDPLFQANVAGAYQFKLRVTDANGQSTGTAFCPDATATVLVTPCDAIHVELLWHTPNDPDQADEGPEAGADLDLHFVHPFAQGYDIDGDGTPDGYFDNPFDTFWFNDTPEWGSLDPAVDDNPSLDRDDTDGAGPENLNLNMPQDGLTYKVGVHYWADHGFGASDATVRIYLQQVLVFEQTLEGLTDCDLWEVAKISWPSGQITPITNASGQPKVASFCALEGWN
jgi:hypothetical protein